MNKKTEILLWVMAIAFIIAVVYPFVFSFIRKRKSSGSDSNFDGNAEFNQVPLIFNIMYEIQAKGRKNEFPMELVKVTDGEIELPYRLSLTHQDYPYRAINIKKGDKVLAANLIEVSYTMNGEAYLHNFFVTKDGYLLSYEIARENFGIKK